MTSEMDALALKSWEEAFTQPLPTTRKLEQQLRQHADSNREKLRTLVGVSYRDLLGTAERIIEMDREMHQVEAILGSTGQRCNVRMVERMGKSVARAERNRKMTDEARNMLAAQLAILEACPTIIMRVLRRKGSLLLSAKILLLSRLALKTTSQLSEVPPLLGSLRDRLGSLRSKLLRTIDKRFADPEREISRLVDDMCAFSLATSSTPSDVLHHFLKVRLRALQWHLEQQDEIKEHAVKAMQSILTTLRNAQAIFPKRLSDSLVRLKDLPLVRQADVQAVPELYLSVHARWLADEIRSYTPWPRHDELQKPDADRILKSWAKSAQQAFIFGLKQCLEQVATFADVLAVRQLLFEEWPWSGSKLPGLHSADVVDALREVINDRLKCIIESTVSELKQIQALTHAELTNQSSESKSPSLWDTSLKDLDVSNGGARFKAAVLTRYNGFNASRNQPVQAFEIWARRMTHIQTQLKHMRDAHWEDEDFGDEEDEELNSKQTLLSEDDPKMLHECLSSMLKSVSVRLVNGFEEMVREQIDAVGQAGVALRVLREVSRRATGLEAVLADVVTPLTTSSSIITPLHSILAQDITQISEPRLSKSLRALQTASSAVGTSLWEGRPPLPVLPSVWSFKFLKSVSKEMEVAGVDLWSEKAVGVLKEKLAELVGIKLKATVKGIVAETSAVAEELDGEVAEVDGNEKEEKEQFRTKKLIQLIFDLEYLAFALTTPLLQSVDGRLASLQDVFELIVKHTELAEAETLRLQKSARDYWRRTYLLFGLLA